MSTSSSDPNEITLSEAYSILSLPLTASTSEIRKSYRTLSLKLHPDKARDVAPEIASSRFDRLQKAYEKLSDPIVREEMVRKAEEETKRREKVDRFERERKKMSDDLVMRERVEEEKRRERKRKERERHEEIQILKERGRKLKEQSMAQMAQKTQVETATPIEPAQGPMDTTVRLLYPNEYYTQLSQSLETLLTSLFGPLIRLHQTTPSSDAGNDKKRKRSQDSSATPTEVSCLATFESLASALRCVETSSDFSLATVAANAQANVPADTLDQIWIEWAAARDILKARKKKKKDGTESVGDILDSMVKDERELKGCKVGEPELVRYWRRFKPDRLTEEMGIVPGRSSTHASNGKGSPITTKTAATSASGAAFEADVLKRAMEVSRAKAAKAQAKAS